METLENKVVEKGLRVFFSDEVITQYAMEYNAGSGKIGTISEIIDHEGVKVKWDGSKIPYVYYNKELIGTIEPTGFELLIEKLDLLENKLKTT